MQLEVRMPSGRFSITDKVTGLRWTLDDRDMSCGRVVCDLPGGRTETYHLGRKGKRGALFSPGGVTVRTGREDDYDDLAIKATFGPDGQDGDHVAELRVEFLTSRAFPTLELNLALSGTLRDSIQYIAYPLGFGVPDERGGGVILPLLSSIHDTVDTAHLAANFANWHPDPGTVTYGTCLFSAWRTSDSGRRSALIGVLDNPSFSVEAHRDSRMSSATPVLVNPKAALSGWKDPYRIRYTVVPDATDEAIAWMFQELLRTESIL